MTREPTSSPVSTKWWKSELMLATNFGSLCPKVTKVGSQNFGYQIWFCTRHRSKETSKLCVTGLCAGNSPLTGEFPTQKASNVENAPFDDFIMKCIGYEALWEVSIGSGNGLVLNSNAFPTLGQTKMAVNISRFIVSQNWTENDLECEELMHPVTNNHCVYDWNQEKHVQWQKFSINKRLVHTWKIPLMKAHQWPIEE